MSFIAGVISVSGHGLLQAYCGEPSSGFLAGPLAEVKLRNSASAEIS